MNVCSLGDCHVALFGVSLFCRKKSKVLLLVEPSCIHVGTKEVVMVVAFRRVCSPPGDAAERVHTLLFLHISHNPKWTANMAVVTPFTRQAESILTSSTTMCDGNCSEVVQR